MTYTIDELRARSDFDLRTCCWHWRGAKSKSGNKASPAIWTFDYDRQKRRNMHGPAAVWSIAHREPLRGRLPYRACGSADCVNPAHHRIAYSRKEMMGVLANLGLFKRMAPEPRRENARKGRLAQGIVDTPEWKVRLILEMSGSNVAIAKTLGMHHTTVAKIRSGLSHRHITAVPQGEPA